MNAECKYYSILEKFSNIWIILNWITRSFISLYFSLLFMCATNQFPLTLFTLFFLKKVKEEVFFSFFPEPNLYLSLALNLKKRFIHIYNKSVEKFFNTLLKNFNLLLSFLSILSFVGLFFFYSITEFWQNWV